MNGDELRSHALLAVREPTSHWGLCHLSCLMTDTNRYRSRTTTSKWHTTNSTDAIRLIDVNTQNMRLGLAHRRPANSRWSFLSALLLYYGFRIDHRHIVHFVFIQLWAKPSGCRENDKNVKFKLIWLIVIHNGCRHYSWFPPMQLFLLTTDIFISSLKLAVTDAKCSPFIGRRLGRETSHRNNYSCCRCRRSPAVSALFHATASATGRATGRASSSLSQHT